MLKTEERALERAGKKASSKTVLCEQKNAKGAPGRKCEAEKLSFIKRESSL